MLSIYRMRKPETICVQVHMASYPDEYSDKSSLRMRSIVSKHMGTKGRLEHATMMVKWPREPLTCWFLRLWSIHQAQQPLLELLHGLERGEGVHRRGKQMLSKPSGPKERRIQAFWARLFQPNSKVHPANVLESASRSSVSRGLRYSEVFGESVLYSKEE